MLPQIIFGPLLGQEMTAVIHTIPRFSIAVLHPIHARPVEHGVLRVEACFGKELAALHDRLVTLVVDICAFVPTRDRDRGTPKEEEANQDPYTHQDRSRLGLQIRPPTASD
jgi:hypothetical protein